LCDATPLEEWQVRCLERLRSVAELRAVLIRDSRADASISMAGPEAATSTGAAGASAGAMRAEALGAHVRAAGWSFILSFSASPCPPALLDAPPFGVWAYHWGDFTEYRGGPAAYWEMYEGSPVTAALLVRLQLSADGVVVLREAYFRTHERSWSANRAQQLARTAHWPAQVCVDIGNAVTHRFASPPRRSAAPVRAAPNRRQRLNCRWRIAVRTVRIAFRSLFRHDQWNIGRLERPIASFLEDRVGRDAKWLSESPRSEFKADPFGVWRDGRLTVLYEHFSYRDDRGFIAALDPEAEKTRATVVIGPQPAVHLSYPYLIETDGRLLCIPESSAAAEVGLYELEKFPDRWIKKVDLLRGPKIVDATPFRHEGLWWLAGSEPGDKGATSELHLWYAQALEGPWQAHAGNPVKMDIRSARSGGTPFYHGNALYRPAQDCSRTYGGRLTINKIVILTPTAFEEVPVTTVVPDPAGPYPAGLHTLSQAGDITLIDGKRVIFSLLEFLRVARHFLRALIG
jgi:hypothetical protein